MHRSKSITKFLLVMVAAAMLFSTGSAAAAEKTQSGPDILLDTYRKNIARLEISHFGLPLFLESSEQGDRVRVDVYGIFDFPFGVVVDMLQVPANWCDIVSLHLNVKACTYRDLPDSWQLTFYLGRKFYQTPEDTDQVIYHYRNVVRQPEYLDIVLSADAGPYGTKDHRMRFEALPLDASRTFVHVSYAYSDSVALRLAVKLYFATFGRDKVGFTVTGTDGNGKPVHIGGPRGSIERNAVRYYFAIESFMNTVRVPEASRFGMRIGEWYDLTARYREQLFELDKEDYLTSKTSEHRNQLMLQQRIRTGLQ